MKVRFTPQLTLLLLAPFIAEVLFGSVPLTHIWAFPLIVGLYGGSALLIRELVRRRNLASYWLLILGIGFALFAEGLVQQSFFNPHYPGIDFLGWYGRAWGVNWVWAVFLTGYHAVFSITIPILLTELIFPDRSHDPWLDRGWFIIAAGLLGISSVAIAVFIGGVLRRNYAFPGWQLLTTVALIGGIVAAAFGARPRGAASLKPTRQLPKPGWLQALAFLAAFAWIFARGLASNKDNLPPVQVPLIGFLFVAAAVALMVWLWSRPGYDWTPEHRFAVVVGPLPVSWLLGFAVAAGVGFFPLLDLVGQLGFGIATYIGLRRLRRRIKDWRLMVV